MASKGDRADEKSTSVSHDLSHPFEPLDITTGSWEKQCNNDFIARRVVRVQQKAMKTNGKRESLIWFCICLVFLRFAVDVYVH